ncbi:hypothetical protein EVAR_97980_1 [Eumeta japonica]|uniref:Uncharacterized protein n=1 Tax=Eumeta variegata TaxID=151549 RepID=A0A4C1XDB8_EUMVA|nr:hypothetical protein EVAR_97980_1 [Eumeta japonica]
MSSRRAPVSVSCSMTVWQCEDLVNRARAQLDTIHSCTRNRSGVYLNNANLALRRGTRAREPGVLELLICTTIYSFQGRQHPKTLFFPPQNLNIPSSYFLSLVLPANFSYLMIAEIKKVVHQEGTGVTSESVAGLVLSISIIPVGTNFLIRQSGILGFIAATRFATRHA